MRRMEKGTHGSVTASTKVRLAKILAVCCLVVIIVVVVVVFRPIPQSAPVLVTHACVDHAATYLKTSAEVTDVGSGPVLRQGFAFREGSEGDPRFDIIPIPNPSFEAGSPLQGWDHVHQCTPAGTMEQVKTGSASAKVTGWDGVFGRFGMDTPIPVEQAAGRTFTFGAWIWTDQPERVRLGIVDRTPAYGDTLSDFHPGDGQWHWLAVTRTITGEELQTWSIVVHHAQGGELVYYIDGAMLVEGSGMKVVFEDGEFRAGEYSLAITGLYPGTSYRVRAFAENQAGIGYGTTVTCATWG